MFSVLRKMVLAVCVLAAAGALPVAESPAMACPNCKAANETDSLKPRAYMYSILFMIGMPATIFTGFSVSFWRLARKAKLEEELLADDEAASAADNEPPVL